MKHRGMIITVAVALLVTIIGIGAVNGISATSIPSEAVPSVTPTQGMSLLGSLDLCPGSPYFESSAATIDPVRGFAYFMGHNCPDYTTPYQGDGSVIKVNLSNFTVAGGASIFGNTPYSGAIDPTTGYSYVT
ncbi:MAG TPA: hypothetical protein VE955_04350, partial [Candidatus Dormibacteraeota bacterium]|nr:hypothetical protein [Candidatus Dormibacteraeota bacterium]